MKPVFLSLPCLALVGVISLRAADPAPAVAKIDPDLPQPINMAVAGRLIENPPFTRALNLSDSLVLTGIAYIDGKPVATILNKSTKESFVVSDEPNAQGWKLAEASASNTLTRTQAKILVGNEIVTVRYSTEPVDTSSPDAKRRPEGGEGGDRGDRGSRARPSEEDRQRFNAMSDKARSAFFEQMRGSREKLMNATQEERSAYIKKMFDNVEQDDKAGKYR
jgi:hypothetical protein